MKQVHSSLQHVGTLAIRPLGGAHRRHRTARSRVVRGIAVLAMVWVTAGIAATAVWGHGGNPGNTPAIGHQQSGHHATVAGPPPDPSRPWMY